MEWMKHCHDVMVFKCTILLVSFAMLESCKRLHSGVWFQKFAFQQPRLPLSWEKNETLFLGIMLKMLLCRQPLRLMDYPVSFGAQTPALGATQAINTSVPCGRPLSHFSCRDTMSTSDTEAWEASETFHGFNRLQIKRYEMEKWWEVSRGVARSARNTPVRPITAVVILNRRAAPLHH